MYRKKSFFLPSRLSAKKLRKVAEITHELFRFFFGDVLGFYISSEGLAALVRLGHQITYDGYSGGFDRVPQHFLDVQIVFCYAF